MNLELLSPAGSYEGFKAALSAGADAVYLGGSLFGARAYARNFSEKELLDAIDEAHILNRKLYLTVNTLVKQNEFESLYAYLKPYYEAGLDAVIVQDVGVLGFIKEHFPKLPLHASTQMTVTGLNSALMLKEYGIKRIIPARELSLEEIKRIYEGSGIEIECFIHGALCYCYSGQCLFSSLIGGRSGNRGRCAQPCRQPYKVSCEKNLRQNGNDYALSLKDLCALEVLPDMVSAGVCSFKIEGRMKRPEYTAAVTGVYRKYLDKILAGEEYKVDKDDTDLLYFVFNREGFTEGYFRQHNGRDMMALRTDNSVKKNTSREREEFFETIRSQYTQHPAKAEVNISASVDGNGVYMEAEAYGIRGSSYSCNVSPAENAPIDDKRLAAAAGRLGDTLFYAGDIKTEVSESVFAQASTLNKVRRQAVESLSENITAGFRRDDAAEFNRPCWIKNTHERETVLTTSVRTMEQLREAKNAGVFGRIYAPYRFSDEIYEEFGASGIFLHSGYASGTYANDNYETDLKKQYDRGFGFLCSCMEDAALIKKLGFAGRTILDYGLYTFNSLSLKFFTDAGFMGDTVPYELNRSEIAARGNSRSDLLVYGRIPLMVSAQCVRKNYYKCDRRFGHMTIKDRSGYEFPVECDCFSCRNIIYNSLPVSLLSGKVRNDLPYASAHRLSFTTESAAEVKNVIKCYFNKKDAGERFTRGHLYRGVE